MKTYQLPSCDIVVKNCRDSNEIRGDMPVRKRLTAEF